MKAVVDFGKMAVIGGRRTGNGMSSGLDVKSVIEAELKPSEDKIATNVKTIAFNNKQITALKAFEDLIKQLQQDIEPLKAPTIAERVSPIDNNNIFDEVNFRLSMLNQYNGGDYINITGTPADLTAEYEIVISQLATKSIMYSPGGQTFTSATAPVVGTDLTAASIIIDVGAVSIPITLTNGESLNTIVSNINSQILNTDLVTASVVKITTNQYKLAFKATNYGTTSNLALTANASGLLLTAVPAVNATLKVGPFDYTRYSNEITDIITGVTLELISPTPDAGLPSPYKIYVTSVANLAGVVDKVATLITDYNKIVDFLNLQYTKVGESYPEDSSLYNNQEIIKMFKEIEKQFSLAIPGITGAHYSSLNQIGVTIDKKPEGKFAKIIIEQASFTEAITEYFSDVKNIFNTTFTATLPNNFILSKPPNNITNLTDFNISLDFTQTIGQQVLIHDNDLTEPNFYADFIGVKAKGSIKGKDNTPFAGMVIHYVNVAAPNTISTQVTFTCGIADRVDNTVNRYTNKSREFKGNFVSVMDKEKLQLLGKSDDIRTMNIKLNKDKDKKRDDLLAKYSKLEEMTMRSNSILEMIKPSNNSNT